MITAAPGPSSFPDGDVVLVTSRSFSSGRYDGRGALNAAGLDLREVGSDHSLETLAQLLPRTVAWIAGTASIGEEHLALAPRLRLIARYGTGVDSVDLEAAREHGVMVTNTPDANTGAVADHTVALILAALRDVPAEDRRVRAGDWRVARTRELSGLTVGIIGVGRIGRAVARRLSGFSPRLIGFDPVVPETTLRELGIAPTSLKGIAENADIVTVHTPGGALIVDGDWLSTTRCGLILINAARASAVDEQSVAAALSSGRLRHYAADALSNEMGAGDSPLFDDELIDRTIFTPHAGAQTVEAVDNMTRGTTEAVLAVLRGEEPDSMVIFPSTTREPA